jgi:CheY-like chemotaxis protein
LVLENLDFTQLANRRVLIVEDEVLVAMDLEDLLMDHGCEVVATVSTVAGAFAALGRCKPEIVILDLNLDGDTTLPVVEELNRRNIPFVVVSGYGELRQQEPLLKFAPLVPKPWNREMLLRSLVSALPPQR